VLQLLLPQSTSTSPSTTTTLDPLLARDPVLLPLALQAASACLDMQGREAGKAVCGFVRRAAALAAAPSDTEAGAALRRLFMGPVGRVENGGQPRGMWLTLGLMTGVCGAMPSWMLDDLIGALASLFQSFGAQTAGGCVCVCLWMNRVR
jgi:hypothetical protein